HDPLPGLCLGTRSAFRHQIAKLTDPFTAVDLLFPLSPKPCLVAISSRHVNSSKSVAAFASGFSSNAYYRTSMPRNPPEIRSAGSHAWKSLFPIWEVLHKSKKITNRHIPEKRCIFDPCSTFL